MTVCLGTSRDCHIYYVIRDIVFQSRSVYAKLINSHGLRTRQSDIQCIISDIAIQRVYLIMYHTYSPRDCIGNVAYSHGE